VGRRTAAGPRDEEILRHAHQESRVLVTLDKDFGELAIVRGQVHCGIVRLVALSTRQQTDSCLAVLATSGVELQKGALVTVEISRVRVRPGDDHG